MYLPRETFSTLQCGMNRGIEFLMDKLRLGCPTQSGTELRLGCPTQQRDRASPMAVPLSSGTELRLWLSHSAAGQSFAYGCPTHAAGQTLRLRLSHSAAGQRFACGSPRGF